jgi:hypothetical protein
MKSKLTPRGKPRGKPNLNGWNPNQKSMPEKSGKVWIEFCAWWIKADIGDNRRADCWRAFHVGFTHKMREL